MKINLVEKIEEIRMQPEHIRLRWVWGSVAVSMLLIFVIWIFSITLMFKSENKKPQNSVDIMAELKDQMQQVPNSVGSLEEYVGDKPLTLDSEGVSTAQTKDSTPASSDISTAPIQSSAYAN
ncbi:MAG: hypothetical protein WCJ51_02895 [Candidatus Moraniibacteriota bacterium]